MTEAPIQLNFNYEVHCVFAKEGGQESGRSLEPSSVLDLFLVTPVPPLAPGLRVECGSIVAVLGGDPDAVFDVRLQVHLINHETCRLQGRITDLACPGVGLVQSLTEVSVFHPPFKSKWPVVDLQLIAFGRDSIVVWPCCLEGAQQGFRISVGDKSRSDGDALLPLS